MKSKIFIKTASVFLLTFLINIFSANAQTSSTATAQAAKSTDNMLLNLLILAAIVLLFVMWGMGQALFAIAKLVREKQKKTGSAAMSAMIMVALLLLGNNAFSQTTEAAATADVSNYGGLNSTAFYTVLTVILTEFLTIVFLSLAIKRLYEELIPEKAKSETTISKLLIWWSSLDKKLFTKAVPIEKEADVLLDHDYDGIRELDNALPPWWKYGFYITIFVGVIYLLNFHVFGIGKNPTEEYAAEMEKARIAKEAYDAQNKDKIDENNVPMSNAVGIAAGKEIFESPGMCSSCHGKMAEGGAGPNLTDDYWIHKGSLNDIYQSIKHGYPDKGMQSWEKTFTPKQISQLASYIKSLRGSNPPNAQPPKGDLFIEQSADSTKLNKTDSLSVKKI